MKELDKYYVPFMKKTLSNFNFEDFWKINNYYYKECFRLEGRKWDNIATQIQKQKSIIFEVDLKKVDFLLKSKNKLIIPSLLTFIEIPSWVINKDDWIIVNIGGISINSLDDNNKAFCITMWILCNKKTKEIRYDSIKIDIDPNKLNIIEIQNLGSRVNNGLNIIDDKLAINIANKIRNLVCFVLIKISKKEYNKYKQWTPCGFVEKNIVFSHDVSKHKRHFWEDSGRFKIPLMSKEQLIEKGYGIDELVFRDGEIRRDVPYAIIGNYLVNGYDNKNKNNRRIKVAKGRVLRQEQKIYRILREIFPNNIIRIHDRRTLKGLELDFNLPELRLGIEYDGEQHYDRKICEEVFKSDFDALIKRDRVKDKLCKKKNIILIRIKYDEKINITNLKKLINNK